MENVPLPKKHAQENNFRTLAENIPGVIYLCNNNATNSMLYLNSKVEELTGYTPLEFITGKISFVQLYHPDDALRIFETIELALSNEDSFQLTYRMATKNGEWRWVEEVGTGIYEDDSLLFIEGFINDITAQKLAEEKLKTVAEENYRIFNNSVSLSVIAGFDGYFKRLNPMWFKLFGWSEEEMLSQQIFVFIHEDDIDVTKEAVRHIADGNNLHTFENRYRCKDGSYKWLLWSSASDKKRKLIYASAIDITERKKFEEELLISKKNLERASEELQKQNDQLNEFAHIISHNLRSPVGNIQALISLLNTDSSKEEYAVIFEKLKNTSLSLRRTLNDLLDTMSIRKEGDGEKNLLKFEDIFAHVKRDLEGEILTSQARIISDFDQCPEITYSKTYLESILLNLLSNALKYRSPDRTPYIRVTTAIKNDRKILQVADNGLGIDLERFGEKIFGFKKTFHEHSEARGVGLFLTKTQIETLGGTITVESKEGVGTTFIITF